jgi:hypothetical protein
MSLDLEAIRRRCEAATPGPWSVEEDWTAEVRSPSGLIAKVIYPRHLLDAEFIAAAREDVPALLAEVERLTAAVAERQGMVEHWVKSLNQALEQRDRLTGELQQARDWEDVGDEWTAAIDAAHPTRSGSHETWGVAMQMVGHRHSKGQLVALVNWLMNSPTEGARTLVDAERTRIAALADQWGLHQFAAELRKC